VRGTQLTFNQLSEGTLKTLALLFYLTTSNAGLLLIEEPEIGIHHGLLTRVVEAIQSVATRKQIICSTHSDFVLDALKPSDVFVVQNSSGRGTVVNRVPESMSSQRFAALRNYLEAEGNLGEYWKHGGLGA
jgi:predicted ATPase